MMTASDWFSYNTYGTTDVGIGRVDDVFSTNFSIDSMKFTNNDNDMNTFATKESFFEFEIGLISDWSSPTLQ